MPFHDCHPCSWAFSICFFTFSISQCFDQVRFRPGIRVFFSLEIILSLKLIFIVALQCCFNCTCIAKWIGQTHTPLYWVSFPFSSPECIRWAPCAIHWFSLVSTLYGASGVCASGTVSQFFLLQFLLFLPWAVTFHFCFQNNFLLALIRHCLHIWLCW